MSEATPELTAPCDVVDLGSEDAASALGPGTDEPVAGAEPGRRVETPRAATCPNCDVPRTGKFCAACGQNNRADRLSLKEMSQTGLAHVFELDVPLLRTLVGLTIRPGRVCREYIAGHRRRYSNPLRYCIITAALYMLCLAVLGVSPGESMQLTLGASSRSADATVTRLQASGVDKDGEASLAGDVVDADDVARADAGLASRAGAVADNARPDALRGTRAMTPERRQRMVAYMVDEARRFLERHMNWLAFLAIPAGAFVLWQLFGKTAYTYAESLVFGYFVFGHIFLYTAILAAVGVFGSGWGILAMQLVEFAYLVWSATVFFGAGVLGAAWRSFFGYLAYTLASMMIGGVVVLCWLAWMFASGEVFNRV